MTEEQIIEYLEHCSTTESCHKDKCPCLKEGHTCIAFESKPVLELVKSQKAEISVLRKLLDKAETEIERLQKETERFADIGKMYSEIKAEAIKEFAERLKKIAYKYFVYSVTVNEIDNLVKEMVGEG